MTDEIKTGGPAFPWCGDLNDTPHIGLGMQLRDYMAAKYMQGVSANPERLYSNDDLAEEAY
ncbi:hypothetical protein AB8970_10530 [Yersinia enterocolitica]|uniref:hypothetical protein n=1 Tax=Yersinia enterocolitica TaxID=630 RepID=UPI003D03D921